VRLAAGRLGAALVGALLIITVSAVARACPDRAREWIQKCASAERIRIVSCPAGAVVVSITLLDRSTLDVELASDATRGFHNVRGIGLSPIGEFADWSSESAAVREGLAALERCVDRDPTLFVASPELTPAPSRRGGPWLLLASAIAVAATCLYRRRLSRRGRFDKRSALVDSGALAGLGVLAIGVRALAVPRAFFHQNGQGPIWVRFALGDAEAATGYGPGYAEMFGWLARASLWPDRPIFTAQLLLGALIAPLAYVAVRVAGAPRSLALVAGGFMAVEPLAVRLSASESYFTACAVLLHAAAVLALVALRERDRKGWPFWGWLAASGLLIAQAVRIHPLCWPAATLTPLVGLAIRGRLRARALGVAIAYPTIFLVVALASGPVLAEVLRGDVAQRWLFASPLPFRVRVEWLALIVVSTLSAALITRRAGMVVCVALAALTWILARATNLLGAATEPYQGAYERLFWPALIAALAGVGARLGARARRAAVIGAALASAAFVLMSWRPLTRLSTDAAEAQWAMEWRGRLPEKSRVYHAERAAQRIVALPLYVGSPVEPRPIAPFGTLPARQPRVEAGYYYRSSLCATLEGRPLCAAFEAAHALELVEARRLDSVRSLMPLPEGSIEVALFRILGPR
jgi:hypothetical protein